MFLRCRGLALAMFIAGAALPGSLSAAPAEFPQANAWFRATPSAVWSDNPVARLEVHIVGRSDVVNVTLKGTGITLVDDGTHGDAKAGDRVFTLDNARLPVDASSLNGFRGLIGSLTLFLRVTLRDGTRTGNEYPFRVAVVNPKLRNVFAVKDYGNGISASAFAFFINDNRHEVMKGYPVADITCGKLNTQAYRKLYSVFPDVFDVAFVVPGEQLFREGDLGENKPYEVSVASPARNIGLGANRAAEFGSKGRLKGGIYLSFDSMMIFNHEICHVWSAFVGDSLDLLDRESPGHWSAFTDIGGQVSMTYIADNGLAGRFRHNGDGTWQFARYLDEERNWLYSPLELYLMGLIPPEEVPPVHVLTSPDLQDPSRVTAASVRTVTIEQITASAGGPRVPDASSSQKEFSVALIAIDDRPFNDAAVAYFSLQAYELMNRDPPEPGNSVTPFFWATGGRATLSTRLPTPLPEPAIPLPAWGSTTAARGTGASPGTSLEEPAGAGEKSGNVSGIVIWNEEPVGGVIVKLFAGMNPSTAPLVALAQTGQDGTYLIPRVTAGEYLAAAFAPGPGFLAWVGMPVSVHAGADARVGAISLMKEMRTRTPEDGASISETKPTLSWDAVPGAETYSVQVFLDRDPWTEVFRSGPVTKTSITLPVKLATGERYQWGVQARTGYSGEIAGTAGIRFSIAP